MLEGEGSPFPDDDFSVDDWLSGYATEPSIIQEEWTETPPESDNSDVDQLRALIAAESGEPLIESLGQTTDEKGPDDGHVPTRTHAKFLGGIMALVLVAGIVTAALLFNQTLTPPTTTPTVLTSRCDSISPTPASVLVGSSGSVYWGCSPGPGAFHVNGAGTVTPTIAMNGEWTSIYIFDSNPPTTNCASAGGARTLTSGSAVSFSSSDVGNWSYCSDFVDAPNPMTPITVSWSQ